MSTLKYKHIFSTVRKESVACFVSFGLSPSTTLCAVSCVLRFRAFSKGVKVTRQDFVVLRGNLGWLLVLRDYHSEFVRVCLGIVHNSVEVITSSHKFTAITGLVKCDVLCLCVRVSVNRYRGNTNAGCFVNCKVHSHVGQPPISSTCRFFSGWCDHKRSVRQSRCSTACS